MTGSHYLKVDIRDHGSPWRKLLVIEVPSEELERAFQDVVEEFRNRVQLPGFRKGHVPRNVIELQFGHSMEHEVLERVVKRSYESVVREQKLDPISYPTIEKIDFSRGKPLTYEAQVELRPKVTPKDYLGLDVDAKETQVPDQDVDRALEELRQRAAEWVPVEREAGESDAVLVNYVRLNAKGKPLRKTEQKDALVELGAPGLLSEFRKNLIGTKAGDHRDFEVAYPPDFGNEELRGRTAAFSVDIQGVRERRVRPLDDEFAREVAGMRDAAELRARVRLNMEGEARLRAQREQEEALVDQIIARNPMDLPESMVREYLEELVQRLRVEGREWSPEEENRFRGEYRPMAERRIKRDLLVDAIAHAESVTVTEDEIERALRGAAEGEGAPPETERLLRSAEHRERARAHLAERKVFALLREKARLKMAVA
ncbi:MAG: trigger factor [Candidatus Eisenbacteria bacterium]|uniref:Trigger factor n=1 Tax=Eiseniibacteriota bacterium TaxID=2212470 RepID=A0A538T552_UNCEI|nr:MAG: trigger factor [Candidatus Eisenbacteria bacterium]